MKEYDAIDVAKRYYSLPYAKRTFKELAKMLDEKADKNTQNQLSKLVRDCEERGLVEFHVASEPLSYRPRRADYEDRLRAFFKLRGAVVVELGPQPGGNPETNQSEWIAFDDKVQKQLGEWARRVWAALMRFGDVVGIAGGRGPYWTAKECMIPHICGSHFVKKVVPLAGQFASEADQPGGADPVAPRHLDADRIAGLLYSELDAEHPPVFVGPITNKTGRKPVTDDVNLALIGIGALGSGTNHRFMNLADSADLRSVKVVIDSIVSLVKKLDPKVNGNISPYHHWVGDVAHCFFITHQPAPGIQLSTKDRRELQGLLTKLNNGLYRKTEPRTLAQICKRGAVLAVAGGPHKAAAIECLLRPKQDGINSGTADPFLRNAYPIISHLVTDDLCARYLLRNFPTEFG